MKRHRLSDLVKKARSTLCCLKRYTLDLHIFKFSVCVYINILQTVIIKNWSRKKNGVATVVLGKVDFEAKHITQSKEGHFTVMRGCTSKTKLKFTQI